jgi:hypothetical protein
MGYKILGFIVWQGGRLFVRSRFTGFQRKAIVAGLGAVVIAGVVAAGRGATSSSDPS